ncbi:hypothetical protein A6R68_12140, partial [Neotoma lepida]
MDWTILVIRTVFSSGKADTCAINSPFIHFNCMVFACYNMIPSTASAMEKSRMRLLKYVINGKPTSMFQEPGNANIKWVTLVLNVAIHNFGILEGFVTTITGITNTRKATEKPMPTGAAKGVDKADITLNGHFVKLIS